MNRDDAGPIDQDPPALPSVNYAAWSCKWKWPTPRQALRRDPRKLASSCFGEARHEHRCRPPHATFRWCRTTPRSARGAVVR